MHSKATRIAYLKRMLRRLEGEAARIQDLVRAGELISQAAELATEQLNKSREELLSELRTLGDETVNG